MGGGLLQLVAYGAQDVYLTGNPQITFFKVVYRRHTNFSLEAIEQTFNGTPTYGSRVTCQISRNGDLINRAYLVVTLPTGVNFCNYIGLKLINYVEIEIGGQRIDRHYSQWLYIWNELSLPVSKKQGYFDMVGGAGGSFNAYNNVLHIPLEFWFCRNIGLSLPLIALQYHEVKINLNFEKGTALGNGTSDVSSNAFSASIWVDYVYLDTDERRRFAQLSHEYLIEQLQFTGQESLNAQQSQTSISIKQKLNFNHPTKELIWVIANSSGNNDNWINFTTNNLSNSANISNSKNTYALVADALKTKLITSSTVASLNPTGTAKLVLNGNDRFAERPGSYFNLIQPYQHHENIPNNAGINVYSFGLKPEEHQPSGTLNMSRIDTAVLNLTTSVLPSTTYYNYSTTSIYVYAVNYNVLRILSGMGGLAYSN